MSRYNLAVGDVLHVAVPGSAQYGAVIDGPFQAGSVFEEWLVVPVRQFSSPVHAAPDEVLLRDDESASTYLAFAWCAQPIRTALLGELHAKLEPKELVAISNAVAASEDGDASQDPRLWADGCRHRELSQWAQASLEEPSPAMAVFSPEYLERQFDIYAAAGHGITIQIDDIARIEQMAQAFYAGTFERGTGEHRVVVPVSPAGTPLVERSSSYGDWHAGIGFQKRAAKPAASLLQSVA